LPKIIDHASYRKTLLAEAVKSFSDNGFEALSMKRLAEALGISHALFYHYFESKQALFLQMTEQLAQDVLADLTGSVDASLSLEKKIERFVERAEARDTDLLRLYRLIGDYARLAGRSRRLENALDEIVSSVRKGFQISLGIDDAQAAFLFTYALGVLQGRSVHPSGPDYSQHRQFLGELVNSAFFKSLRNQPCAN